MNDRTYTWLKRIAIALALVFATISVYDCHVRARNPGDLPHLEADNLFADGDYTRALEKYEAALSAAPDHIHALRGKARSLLKLGRHEQALATFDLAIGREPEFGPSYANRGILKDSMGLHRQAIEDYETALRLDPELAEGPNWLTRFLRLQPDKPPGIAERAAYLRAELAKPRDQQQLRDPERDAVQRSYKQ